MGVSCALLATSPFYLLGNFCIRLEQRGETKILVHDWSQMKLLTGTILVLKFYLIITFSLTLVTHVTTLFVLLILYLLYVSLLSQFSVVFSWNREEKLHFHVTTLFVLLILCLLYVSLLPHHLVSK